MDATDQRGKPRLSFDIENVGVNVAPVPLPVMVSAGALRPSLAYPLPPLVSDTLEIGNPGSPTLPPPTDTVPLAPLPNGAENDKPTRFSTFVLVCVRPDRATVTL
jgi:hypothetical protein